MKKLKLTRVFRDDNGDVGEREFYLYIHPDFKLASIEQPIGFNKEKYTTISCEYGEITVKGRVDIITEVIDEAIKEARTC